MKKPSLPTTPKLSNGQKEEKLREELSEGPMLSSLVRLAIKKHFPKLLLDHSYARPKMARRYEYPSEMPVVTRVMFESYLALAAVNELKGDMENASEPLKAARAIFRRYAKNHHPSRCSV